MTTKITLLLLATLILGCGGRNEPSSEIKTSNMYAEFTVVTDPEFGSAEVTARLRVKNSSGKYIKLEEEDALWVNSNGEKRELLPYAIIANLSSTYSERFGDRAAENTEFTISLNRENRRNAPKSTAKLPGIFSIELPLDDATLQRSDDITYVWSPGQTTWKMEIETLISCKDGTQVKTFFEFEDSEGIAILSPEDHSPPEVLAYTGECSHHVYFNRVQSGTVDKNFAGGYFKAVQQRVIYITTTH